MSQLLAIMFNCFLVLGTLSFVLFVAQAIIDEVDWKTVLAPLALTPVLTGVCLAMLASGPL